MAVWLAVLVGAVILAASALLVHRYSRRPMTLRLTIAGRGLYLVRTPDGTWLRLSPRRHPRNSCWPGRGDEPPDIASREPRRPHGPRPATGARIGLP